MSSSPFAICMIIFTFVLVLVLVLVHLHLHLHSSSFTPIDLHIPAHPPQHLQHLHILTRRPLSLTVGHRPSSMHPYRIRPHHSRLP